MPAASLYQMSMKACIKNVWSIEGVGDMLYSQIKPVLSRVKDADQLRRIEENSPQIMGETTELWKKLIARDVPTWEKKNYVPKNPEAWYKVYKRYVREQKEEILRDQEKLRETMMGIKSKRDQHTSQLVNLKSVVVPRDPRMRIGDGAARRRGGGSEKNMSTLNFTAGSKTKMVDGKSVLNRARKEAKEIHAMGRLNKLTHTLAGSKSQIKKAPEGMRREYEIAAQPALSRVLLSKRKATLGFSTRLNSNLNNDLDEREARLRRAMQPSGSKTSSDGEVRGKKRNVIDFSEDDEGHDDLFDESPPKKLRVAAAAPPPAQTANSKPLATSKPSDMISKMLAMKKNNPAPTKSRSKPSEDPVSATSISEAQPQVIKSPASSSAPQARSSPPTAAIKRPPPPPGMMPRKKKEVDIFNRKAMRRPPQRSV